MFPRVLAASLAACLIAASAVRSPSAPAATPAAPPAPATALALAVPSSGRDGFRIVPPETSGIRFTNRLAPPVAAFNRNLMNGAGVAAGDFDGDGRCDLYVCAIDGTNALFRNLGNWRFEDVTERAGVGLPQSHAAGAVWADVDADGDLDLLVSTLGAGVRSFRNLGEGRFRESTADDGLTTTHGSTTLCLGDVDHDGDLDLYVANYGAFSALRSGGRAEVRRVNGQWVVSGPHGHRLRFIDGRIEEVGEADVLYLNDGSGRFQAVPWNSPAFLGTDGQPKPPPLDYGLGAQIRDINGDGHPDIYVCNDFQTPDRFWINDGRGRFREAPFPVLRKFPFSSMGVDFADLDRDGHLDFLVLEMASREHERQMRQVTGAPPHVNVPGRFEARPQVPRNALYRGNGDGTWSEIAEFAGLAASDWSWQPVFLDVDLDGYEDLLVVNGMIFDTQDRDTLARVQAMGRLSPEDARSTLLLYPPFLTPNAAFRNRGDLTFEECAATWGFDSRRISQGIALADLDHDGDLDAVINCLNDGLLLLENRTVAPRLAVRLRGLPGNPQGIGARLRVLGGPVVQTQEILAGGRYLSSDEALRVFATGKASRLTLEVTWPSGSITTLSNALPNHLYVVHESPDRHPSARPHGPSPPTPWFADASPRLQHRHHEELFDDYARQPLLHRQLSALGPGVAWNDLDQDGIEELVIGTGRGGHLAGFRFLPGGTVESLASTWTAPDDVQSLAAWTTTDGRPALLGVVSTYESTPATPPALIQITTAPGTRHLTVEPLAGLPPLDGSCGALAVADYDGDGDLDVFVGGRVLPGAYPGAPRSRLLRREGPQWVDDPHARDALAAAGMVSAALWTDLEDDGFPELVLAVEWGSIRVFRNHRGRLTEWDPPVLGLPESPAQPERRLSALTGWWTSLTAADLDGDGRLDLVAGNWGWNTGYRASLARPLRLYFGHLSGGPTVDLIEAYYPPGLDAECPRRSFNALGQAFPFLSQKYPSHEAFARARLPDLLPLLPDRPHVLTAATLATTAFLQRTTGWDARPLPAEAQFAPCFGLTVADIDTDGHQDLFLAQNFFAMRIEWPRIDAGRGLWLRGDGAGGFTPLPATDSGVVLLGEQRGAALGDADGDGRPDLVVAQNGAATTLWRNSTVPIPTRVLLAGPPGNPRGHGATLRLRASDGRVALRELRSGNGYSSQDAPVAWFAPSAETRAGSLRWPGGATQEFTVAAGATSVVVPWVPPAVPRSSP